MYRIELSPQAKKALAKLEKKQAIMIAAWIRKNLNNCDNPRLYGKAMQGKYKTLWRYRVGEYRIIANIEDSKLVVLLLKIGHRKEIYK